MTKREVIKRLKVARTNVAAEIRDNASGYGKFAGGLSSEGYAGGYLQALNDVAAMLTHGCPGDPRHYWPKDESI